MNTTGRIQHQGQVTIPTRLRTQAGLSKGDLVQFSLQRGKIVITPKALVDHSQFPSADDEYTPAQCRAMDARLPRSAEKDLKAGRTAGPFRSADEMIAHLKAELKKRAAAKAKKRLR